MLASFLKRDLRNLFRKDASPNFQAQNGLLSLRSRWRSVRSLVILRTMRNRSGAGRLTPPLPGVTSNAAHVKESRNLLGRHAGISRRHGSRPGCPAATAGGAILQQGRLETMTDEALGDYQLHMNLSVPAF